MRYRKTHHTNHTLDTPFGDVELTFSADMAEYGGALAHREGDKLVVAYLSHDDDPCNHPLDDCDGMGYIVGRGKYEMRDHPEIELFEALGLDRYGDTNYELVADLVNDAWKAYIEALSDEVWAGFIKELGFPDDEDRNEYVNKWRDELMDTNAFREGQLCYIVGQANEYISWSFDPNSEARSRAAAWLDFDVEKKTHEIFMAEAEAGRIGNPCAVMLDVYDHSGTAWSLNGRGTQCRWDTSRGAGVWLPNGCAREEIERRAPIYATTYIRQTVLRMNVPDKKYQLIDTVTDRCVAWGDDWGDLWRMAEVYATAAGDLTPGQIQMGRFLASQELASEAVETYNQWSSGDVYGCVVETFDLVSAAGEDPVWELCDDESCWGFIGSDNAKRSLIHDFFEPAVKAVQNSSVALG